MLRRANAPRLIGWTGERCVPWTDDTQVIYEHLHRYLWARSIVQGRRVLDVGSGEGFGAAILAEVAAAVQGVDVDEVSVKHAQLKYGSDTVSFMPGDARSLPEAWAGQFDVVVLFEVLEHVAEQEQLLNEVRRVLAPGGVVFVSTPNRLNYAAEGESGNPFHVRELSDQEFRDLLGATFAHARYFHQRVAEGSRIDLLGGASADAHEAAPLRIKPDGDEWAEASMPDPNYLIAVASDETLVEPQPSTLLDHSLSMLRRHEELADQQRQELSAALVAAEQRLAAELEKHAAIVRERDDRVAEVERTCAQLVADRDVADGALRAAQQQEAAALDRVHELAQRCAEQARRVERAQAEAAAAEQALARTNESVTWRGLQKVKGKVRGNGDRPRLVGRVVSRALRGADAVQAWRKARRATAQQPAEPAPPPPLEELEPLVVLPTTDTPVMSIVIPVYDGVEMTLACLQAIASSAEGAPAFEVIIAEDAAPQAVKDMLHRIDGARVISNPENLGFLRSVNRAVAEARGEMVVLLNNDTEPQPGWLQALQRRLSEPGVGAVGGRLIYPDGRLQEAGGVLFRDGSAINYGNGSDPGACAFRFARPVDYCSAALLAIKTSLWQQLEGFDELFVPGYYEDTDLCFRVREAGYEVWFEPEARVIHKEGGSHGTDVTQGVKRHQVINQQHFAERWGASLEDRPPTATVEQAWVHANRVDGPVVFVADHMVPEPDRDSGSLRMTKILEALVELGARVVFCPANGAWSPQYAKPLEAKGIEVVDGATLLRARLSELGPVCRLVILSRPAVAAQLLPDIRTFVPDATVLYDTVDLHWVREEGRSSFEPVSQRLIDALREQELALARASDLVAVVTKDEQELLAAVEPNVDVRYLPNVHDIVPSPGRDGRQGVLFVGGFRHLPNVDAALELGERIMPALRERELSISLSIVGPDAPAEIQQLQADDIEVLGWVEDVVPLLDGSIALVAPLRYGAGMKGKIGQALAHGLPVVTTAVGAQGFGLEDGVNALIAETPQEFAEAVERLTIDVELWQRLSDNGRTVIERTCSSELVRELVAGLLEEHAGAASSVPG